MKLSAQTLAILKNFAVINQGIKIEPGNELATIAKEKCIVGYATIAETFDVGFEIWNLPVMLQVLSVIPDPDIEWRENYALLKSGKVNYKYLYGRNVDPVPPPRNNLKKREFDATFDITAEELSQTMKMANVMGANHFVLDMEAGEPSIQLVGTENSDKNIFTVAVDAEVMNPVSMSIKREHLSIMMVDYTVRVSEAATLFTNSDMGLMYLVAAAAD